MEAENLKKLTADQWLDVLGGLIAVEQLLPEMIRDSKQRETLTAALRMGEVAVGYISQFCADECVFIVVEKPKN